MLNHIDSIIFDLGGVILNLDYNRTVEEFKKLGKENFDSLYAKSQQDKIFDQFETGHLSGAQFIAYMKQFLDTPTTDAAIENAWNAMLLDLPVHRIELLAQLKKKYKTFLFSNTNEIHVNAFRRIIQQQHGNPDLLESLFHQTYYSNQFGKRKPDALAFQTILDEHQLEPQKTLFIDDSIQHIEGAKKLGIQTIHLVDKDIKDLGLL